MIKSTIGEISTLIKTGKTPPSKTEEYFVQDYNWYTPGDIGKTKFLEKSHRGVSDKAIQDKKAFLYPKSTLLITCIGNIGRIGITKEKSASNQQITAIKPIEEIDVEFLYYWFYENQKFISEKANNAVVPILNNKSLKEISISYPPLETQKHIAQILDDAAALRDKTQQLLNEYDQLAQSIFLDMFGDPVSNSKSFEKISLKEITDISSGSTPSRKNENNFNGHIPWVKTGEVDSSLILDTKEKITEEGLKSSSCKIYEKGSLIIAMYGQGKTRGKVSVLGIPATTNQACAVLSPSNKMNFTYLYEHIKIVYKDLRSLGRGGGQPNLNSALIKNYKVLNPPINLQNQFAAKIALIEQQKALAKQELQESEDLFHCLLQRGFLPAERHGKGELV